MWDVRCTNGVMLGVAAVLLVIFFLRTADFLHTPYVEVSCSSMNLGACPQQCSNRGICVEGRCYCKQGSWGMDCAESTDSLLPTHSLPSDASSTTSIAKSQQQLRQEQQQQQQQRKGPAPAQQHQPQKHQPKQHQPPQQRFGGGRPTMASAKNPKSPYYLEAQTFPSPHPLPSFDPDHFVKRDKVETLRVTFLGVPKRFNIHEEVSNSQRNAILSWTMLRPKPDIVLFGDEYGIAEFSKEIGALHVPHVARTDRGTPTLDYVLKYGEAVANTSLICFINSDIILTSDFILTAEAVVKEFASNSPHLLVVGQRTNLARSGPIVFDANWEESLIREVQEKGKLFTPWGEDYFLHTVGLFTKVMPPFAIGRPPYDNWMVHKAWWTLKVPTVDAGGTITAIHQNHDYRHLAKANAKDSHDDPECDLNNTLGKREWSKGASVHVPHVSFWCGDRKVCIKKRQTRKGQR